MANGRGPSPITLGSLKPNGLFKATKINGSFKDHQKYKRVTRKNFNTKYTNKHTDTNTCYTSTQYHDLLNV